MKKVVTIGEIMLRLSTPGFQRFIQAESFDACYGGGEANVCVSLANYGLDARFVTKLPKHEIGQSAVNALRRFGVNTDYIARGGDRLGIYFFGKRCFPTRFQGDLRSRSISHCRSRSC